MGFVIFLGFISLLVTCYYGLKWKKSDERLKWTKKYVYSLGLTIILFLVSVFGSIASHDYEVKQSAALAISSSKRASYISSSKSVSSRSSSKKAARQKELDTEKLTLYPVSITSVKRTSGEVYDDLVLSGTTNAPDGAIILVSYDTDQNLAETESEYDTGYAKVKNNKFKAAVILDDLVDLVGNKALAKNPTISLQVFAVQGYTQSYEDIDFTNNLNRELKKQNIARTKITLPDKVLKDKTASSSSSSSRSSSSTFNASEYSKNISWSQLIHNPDSYTNAQVCMSGKVTQRQVTDDDFVTLQVEVDDDPDHYIVLEYDHELEKKLSGTDTVVKGDNITVYGESVGNEERETILGAKLTVAAIAPEKIVIN